MLGSITKSLKKVFGDKSSRDMKDTQPMVKKVNEAFATIGGLSNDQLREKTLELRKKIQLHIKEKNSRKEELLEKAENDNVSIEEKEGYYDEIDTLTKEIDVQIEEVLMEILPEAFAIVKETAKRFKEKALKMFQEFHLGEFFRKNI